MAAGSAVIENFSYVNGFVPVRAAYSDDVIEGSFGFLDSGHNISILLDIHRNLEAYDKVTSVI
jgi:hypothetical protein